MTCESSETDLAVPDTTLAKCAWGNALEKANRERSLFMPGGWTRVFEAHLGCAPGCSYYEGAPAPFEALFTAYPGSIRCSVERSIPLEKFHHLSAVMAADAAWLKIWDAKYVHVCGPLVKMLEEVAATHADDKRARTALDAVRAPLTRAAARDMLRALPHLHGTNSKTYLEAIQGIEWALRRD